MESKYYRPYRSDSEDSSFSSESETSQTSYINTAPNFVNHALSLGSNQTIGGPSFTDISSQVFYSRPKEYSLFNSVFENVLYNVSSTTFLDTSQQQKLLEVEKTQLTSIVLIDSKHRDKQVYPQPTNISLRLPRTYTNILNFQIVQIKLLSAFFYFRQTKQNITVPINEQGRYLDTNGNATNSSSSILNIITTTIREGSYDINSLVNELIIQLNTPPIFYDFINGFNDFVPLFTSTGDYSTGLNLPGDYFYDSSINEFIVKPTIDQIVTKYFQSRYAGQTSYSVNDSKIAYYYPVLKEILLDDNYSGAAISFNGVDTTLLFPSETPYTRCVYYFQGLNDSFVLNVINLNITVLDAYRLAHTFRNTLVNKYNVFYDTFNNRISINTPSLNTSLSNLLVGKQNTYFSQQLALNNLTYSNYLNLQSQNTLLLITLTDMYNYLQKQFATYFGVNFNTFSLGYYGSMANYIDLRNGSNAVVSSSYDSNVINRNVSPLSNNIISNYQVPPSYWPSLSSNARSSYPLRTNYSNYVGNPFNLQSSIPETYHTLQTSNDLYTSRLLNHVDAVVNIEPASYTVFQFKSNFRQTLQVETLPRPTKYRYPEYNSNAYDASYNFFSTSYTFVSDTRNAAVIDPTVTVTPLPGFTSITDSNFGITLSNSYALWSNTYATISQVLPTDYYSFTPPYPTIPGPTTQAYKYTISLNVSVYPSSSTFPIPLYVFVYHDIGAFYADVNGNESKYNYISSNYIDSNTTTKDITFQAFQTVTSNQKYYIIIRSQTPSPIVVNYVITPYFPNNTSYTELSNDLTNFNPLIDPQTSLNNWLYAKSYDSNFLALPSSSNLFPPVSFYNAYFPPLSFNDVSIGYDTNGISTDLTHYIGYVQDQANPSILPTSLNRIDPMNGYIFAALSQYNSTTQTYFYTNSSNNIKTPNTTSIYTPTSVSYRNYAQVHYYGTHYLPNTRNQPSLNCNISLNVLPFTNASFSGTLSNYSFNSNGNLELGDGIYGLSLIPGEGTWDMQKYMFKSIFTQSNWYDSNSYNYQSDPNLSIQYLGVFYTTTLIHKSLLNMQLSNAIVNLTFSKSVLYNSSNTNFGYGSDGGTYYEFIKQKGSYLYGFTENSNSITTDYNNGYTILAFDSLSNLIPFIGVAGSLTPYPYYSDAIASNTYFDGTTTSNAYSLIIPQMKTSPDLSRGPPTNGSERQAQYEQSMPIGTTYQMYRDTYSLLSSNSMIPWSNIGFNPDAIFMNIPNYMMTQGSEFKIYSYDSSSNRNFVYQTCFTADELFNYNSNITLVGVSANDTTYVFLALSNTSIIIKSYNPITTDVTEIYNGSWLGISKSNVDVMRFTYNNYGGYTISFIDYTGVKTSKIYSIANSNSSNYLVCSNVQSTDPTTLSHYRAYQHPDENNGKFYIASALNTSGFVTMSIVDPTTILSPTQYTTYITNRPQGISAQINGSSSYVKVTDILLSVNLNQLAINRVSLLDTIYGYTSNNASRFYQITSYSVGTNPYDSNASLTVNSNASPKPYKEIEAGYKGGLWSVDLSGNIYGNRNIFIDTTDGTLNIAWQLFYPVQRVVYKNISKSVNTLQDLSGLTYPEYPHTQIFAYSNDSSFTTDISGNASIAPWGNEKNFFISDTKYSGYYFNAYTTFIPLESNVTPYYVAVRNYSPFEKSQVYMRFSLPKRYDFGYMKFSDISNEILSSSTNTNSFNPNYTTMLQAFNKNFIFTNKTFGGNVVSGYAGETLSNVTGFGDFMKYYTNYYGIYTSNVTVINTINNNTNANLSNFIATDLQYIIPASANNRQKYTDPLLFSLLWKSELEPQYAKLEEDWGLGYNLGYKKQDTTYDLIHKADSFYKILDDYINLQINTENTLNLVDTTAKENLALTLDSTGGTKQYYGKLLLANFGSYAQTMIMNPVQFNPPLGKLDHLTFQWIDNTNQIINNGDCEWTATVQIVEIRDTVKIPTVPLLNPR